jgi:hypothetical protein
MEIGLHHERPMDPVPISPGSSIFNVYKLSYALWRKTGSAWTSGCRMPDELLLLQEELWNSISRYEEGPKDSKRNRKCIMA